MGLKVKPKTLPRAGIDNIKITIDETYEVSGVGKDKVTLTGTLVADRGAPLLGHGRRKISWKTSTVVARFTKLSLRGKSDVFGRIKVSLDRSVPSFGIVAAGKCNAALAVNVSMPDLGLNLKSSEPVQLHSTVTTVPPIGDEKTRSVRAVKLLDRDTNRTRGKILKAQVAWRELTSQKAHKIALVK